MPHPSVLPIPNQIIEFSNEKSQVNVENSLNKRKQSENGFNLIHSRLQKFWPIVLEEILGDEELDELFDISKYLRQLLEYTVPFGKQTRATMFIHMCQLLRPDMSQKDSDQLYKEAWILEILQASALLYDDLMDDSTTRRGKLCWHLQPEVGKAAINDAIFLENIIYKLLSNNKNEEEDDGHKKYMQIVEFIHSIILRTTYGQSLDTRLPLSGSILNFTMDKYKKIVKYKTSLYTFYGPIGIAMIRNGNFTPANMIIIDKLTTLIGELFQVQDDYLDCFGKEEVTGKVGTDIQDGKCTWLIVKALEICTPNQKNILLAEYGNKGDSKSVQRIKEVYEQLDLPGIYFDYEDEMYDLINEEILNLPNEIPNGPFNMIMKTMYKRKK